ncbi:MAG: hypothetical protein GX022_08870 [Clostridiaceae bacterium]|nr:hypothetical protein [Clostridiaceae bacterium]
MMAKKAGRKSRAEKLEILKEELRKKISEKEKINNEIKEISSKIAEIEQFLLLQKAAKLKETLDKKGISIDDVTEAIESGNLNLPGEKKD